MAEIEQGAPRSLTNVIALRLAAVNSDHLKSGDGGGTFDGMEQRVRNLEVGHAVVVERINSLERRMDGRFDQMDKRFDDLGKRIDKLPNEWAMARVVFYVVGALMAAAIFGPRLVAMLPSGG